MTIEEAIKNRERCLKYLEGLGAMATPENVEAVRLSLAALRAQQEVDSWNRAVSNDELMVELREKAKGLEFSIRWLILEAVRRLETANKERGRWIPTEPESDVRFYCSECETEVSTSWDYDCDGMWNFCPHCGAIMDQ